MEDLDGAIACRRRAVLLNPSSPVYPFNLALLLRENGELEAAIAAYRAAIEIDQVTTGQQQVPAMTGQPSIGAMAYVNWVGLLAFY